MNELINIRDSRVTIRWKLLTSASVLALTVYASAVKAEDTDRPQIWIELGGQMENVSGQGKAFAPAFLAANPTSSVLWTGVTPLQAQKPPQFSFGEEGKISFQPEGSDWIFSAGLRYGRSNNSRHVHHQTYKTFGIKYNSGVRYHASSGRAIDNFSDTLAGHREHHAILDFLAGKDVGLGMFGKDSSSILSIGVRFAQFGSNASFEMRARPDLSFKYVHVSNYYPSVHASFHLPYYQTYHAIGHASRAYRGLGPALSWSGSMPFAGNKQDSEIALDWGINASVLFGKQKTRVQHQQSQHYVKPFWVFTGSRFTGYPAVPEGHNTDRSVTVPNIGGSLGISFRRGDAKVSFGYRADFFFGAMDGGIDTRREENRGFFGPFASISVGIGD